MDTLRKALWQGVMNGAATRDHTAAPKPESLGFTGAISQGLYNLGLEFANAVVYGTRK
jgi:hypothetical protein